MYFADQSTPICFDEKRNFLRHFNENVMKVVKYLLVLTYFLRELHVLSLNLNRQQLIKTQTNEADSTTAVTKVFSFGPYWRTVNANILAV